MKFAFLPIALALPIEIAFTPEEQQVTYNILVSSLLAESWKKTLDGIAFDLSNVKWPDSGKNRFNVTLLSDVSNKLKS
jgi:hypothetical protein